MTTLQTAHIVRTSFQHRRSRNDYVLEGVISFDPKMEQFVTVYSLSSIPTKDAGIWPASTCYSRSNDLEHAANNAADWAKCLSENYEVVLGECRPASLADFAMS